MKILISNRQKHLRLNRTDIRRAAKRILSLLRLSKAELSILFVDDRVMKDLNATFRDVNRTTDVLSFPAGIPVKREAYPADHGAQEPLLGDIVINVQRAYVRSGGPGKAFYDEVCRLLIHGTMHLLGYDHEERQDAERMRKKEKEIFRAVKKAG